MVPSKARCAVGVCVNHVENNMILVGETKIKRHCKQYMHVNEVVYLLVLAELLNVAQCGHSGDVTAIHG